MDTIKPISNKQFDELRMVVAEFNSKTGFDAPVLFFGDLLNQEPYKDDSWIESGNLFCLSLVDASYQYNIIQLYRILVEAGVLSGDNREYKYLQRSNCDMKFCGDYWPLRYIVLRLKNEYE